MLPLQKNQSLEEYAKAAAQALIEHAEATMVAKGANAAWDEIFKAICSEGQHVREVSPSAIVIYQYYVVVAATFLAEFPDTKKLMELATRAKEDLGRLTSRVPQMKDNNFTREEYISVSAAMGVLAKTIRSLV